MLDLTMRITADGSQAKGELRSVEQSIQRVESASNQTTPAIGKIGTALTQHGRSMEEWEHRIAAIEANTAKLSGTVGTATESLSGFSAGAGLSEAALLGVGAAAVGGAVALGSLFALLGSSAKYYVEHAKGAQGVRDAISDLGQAWDDVKMKIGEAIIGGSEDSMGSALRVLGNLWRWIGDQTAYAITEAKEYTGLRPTSTGARRLFGTTLYGSEAAALETFGALLDPNAPKMLGTPQWLQNMRNPEMVNQASMMHGVEMGAVQGGLPASVAEMLFRQDAAARRAASRGARAPTVHPYATVPNLPDHLGMYGFNLASLGYGSAIDLGAAGFTYAQVPNIGYAPPGGSGLSMLWGLGTPSDPGTQLIRPPSLTSQLFGNLGTDVAGQIFRMVGRGSNSIGGQLGGAVGGSIAGGLGEMVTKSIGGTLGKTVGGFLGPLGAIGGSLLGSLFGSLFGETQGHKDLMEGNRQIADMKKQLLDTYGSMENLQRLGKEFGIDWQATWGDQNLAGAEHFKGLMDQMAAKTVELNQKIADTKAQIHALGGDGEVTWQTLSEAVQRYGGDISKLGGTFQTARMHDEWQQIIDDMDLFIRGGISAGDALGLMSGKIDALVIQSLQFGTTIPENMRPYIQTLIDQGKLLDASGEKITDISKLSFGETLQTTLEKLNATLETLVKTLSGDIPAAAESGADRVQKAFDGIRLPQYGVTDPGNAEPLDAATAHRGAYVGMYGALPAFHRGGEVPGWLLPGEFVMQKSAVQQYGLSTMRAMNSGALGRSSAGGAKNYLPVKIELSGRPVWEGLLEVAHAEGMV